MDGYMIAACSLTGAGVVAYAVLRALNRPVRVRRDAPDHGPWVDPHKRWPRNGGPW